MRPYNPKPLDVVRDPGKLAGLHRRTLRLSTDRIDLMRGATVLRSVPFDARSTVSFSAVAAAVGPGPWVKDLGDGQLLLKAAFAQGPGTSVRFGGDGTDTIRLAARPDVFIGGVQARATFQDVLVTSWNVSAQQVDRDYRGDRPFILYEGGSVLDIVGSEIAYLGSDRSMAYGTSWRLGATGSMTDSDVHDNFFGVYSFRARDLRLEGNRIHDNVYYGVDPHDYTKGLDIRGNEVYGNGDHGIVLSVGVTDGVIAQNHVHDNDGNGIVMDERSDGNLIEGNRSERNRGDGIVVLGSSRVVVRGNVISDNRVGVRLNHDGEHNVVRSNTIQGNREGVEVYDGAVDTLFEANRISSSSEAGMVLEEVGSVSRDDRISDGPVGIEVRGPATIEGSATRGVERGIVVTSRGIAEIDGVDLEASDAAVELDRGAIARVRRSRLAAPDPFTGAQPRLAVANDIAHPWWSLPWFAIAGLSFVLLALVLQAVHRTRNIGMRRHRSRAPAGVSNAR
ncbi:MAG TPA: right-handed parallel beta-helix repeat-containing protein [Actinomycetota bacterium]|nr:right-handed parallel beta-helix repeat-containing protein [Actinomycetota bacterium]